MDELTIIENPALPAELVADAAPRLEDLGAEIVGAMKAHHTYKDQRAKVLTDSLTFSMDRETGGLLVGTPKFWGRFVEEGTSRAAAKPFLLPALLESVGPQ